MAISRIHDNAIHVSYRLSNLFFVFIAQEEKSFNLGFLVLISGSEVCDVALLLPGVRSSSSSFTHYVSFFLSFLKPPAVLYLNRPAEWNTKQNEIVPLPYWHCSSHAKMKIKLLTFTIFPITNMQAFCIFYPHWKVTWGWKQHPLQLHTWHSNLRLPRLLKPIK